MQATLSQDYRAALGEVISDIVELQADIVDRDGSFPSAAMAAMGDSGLLGLISAREAGGLGFGLAEAAEVVGELAQHCGSTAMVACMHYAAVVVIEAHAPLRIREEVAAGRAFATLAFSEAGSRSHFWAPLGTATPEGDRVRLDGRKSWVTSAGQADFYVWSSKPLRADGASTLWLVPSRTPGVQVSGNFDGLGLRGNCSSPVTAEGALLDQGAMLGSDGGGFDIMMSTVLPIFQIMNAAVAVGTMEAATRRAQHHVSATSLEHLGQALADLPTIRAYVARMRIKTDLARALLLDTIGAVDSGRDDAMLRILEVKAAAGELALEVTDLAMRVCGGAAFRKEVGVERQFRDARAGAVMAPTTDVLYEFIGRAACGLPLF
ncbi:MAG: acyl-CoA/acyl-ACP dehydrogenase [Dehalococcoidia bacterium]|nr:acyl-CoA/acyl-ACP dehydrogenase [Dehalococcoidia bacterium]